MNGQPLTTGLGVAFTAGFLNSPRSFLEDMLCASSVKLRGVGRAQACRQTGFHLARYRELAE